MAESGENSLDKEKKQHLNEIYDRLEEEKASEHLMTRIQQLSLDDRRYMVEISLTRRSLPLLKLLFSLQLVRTPAGGSLDMELNDAMLSSAIEADFVDGIEYLYARGLALQHSGKWYSGAWYALHLAILREKLASVKFLLTLPNLNKTAEINFNHFTQVQLHLNISANIYICSTRPTVGDINQNQTSLTPLDIAALMKNIPLLKLLVSNVDVCSDIGRQTCLYHCLLGETEDDVCVQCLEILIKAGADVNFWNTDVTVLILAALRGFIKCVKYLLDNGANVHSSLKSMLWYVLDLNARLSTIGIVGYKYAEVETRVDIAKYLIQRGAKLSNDLETIFHLLSELSSSHCMDLAKFVVNLYWAEDNSDSNTYTPVYNRNRTIENTSLADGRDTNNATKSVDSNSGQHATITSQGDGVECNDDTQRVDSNTGKHAIITSQGDGVDGNNDTQRVDSNSRQHVTITSQGDGGDTDYHIDLDRQRQSTKTEFINRRDQSGVTALMRAAKRKQLPFVKFLLENGADPYLTDDHGRNVISSCVENPKDDDTAVHLLKLFINAGVDVLGQVKRHKLLHKSSASGQYKCFQYLLELIQFWEIEDIPYDVGHGFARSKFVPPLQLDLITFYNVKDQRHNTPLMIAAFLRHQRFLEDAVERRVPVDTVNLQNACGHTALHLCIIGFIKSNKGTRITEGNTDFEGHLTNFNLIHSQLLECIRLLLSAGADVDIPDMDGRTALMFAAMIEDVPLVKTLLNAGAKVNILDYVNNMSALHYVGLNFNLTCFELLMCQDCDDVLNSPCKDGNTLIQTALLFPIWWNPQMSVNLVRYLISRNCCLTHLQSVSSERNYFQEDVDLEAFSVEERDELRNLLYLSGAPTDEIIKTIHFQVEDILSTQHRKNFALFCNNVSLEELSSRTIRQCLGTGLERKVLQLDIPRILQGFLLLKDKLEKCYFHTETRQQRGDDEVGFQVEHVDVRQQREDDEVVCQVEHLDDSLWHPDYRGLFHVEENEDPGGYCREWDNYGSS